MTIVVLVIHLASVGLELPHVVQKRLHREWWVLLTLTALNLIISLLLVAGLQIPSPADWLDGLLGPLVRLLGV